MDAKVWVINDSLQCQQMTAAYLEEAVSMMDAAFFRHETVSRCLGLPNDTAALAELKQLTTAAAKDGVSVIAIDKTTNKVIGAAFNKLQVKDNTAFANFANSWKQKRAKAIIKFMAEVDSLYNFFDKCGVDCLLEFMFVGILPEYRKKGVAKKLCEATIEIGKDLARGVNVKRSVDGRKLGLEPVPKIITAIFTCEATKVIGKKLGFKVVVEEKFEEYEFEGRNFASVVGDEISTFTLEYRDLK
jgi:GNAT superfamily N-acetyltransferase